MASEERVGRVSGEPLRCPSCGARLVEVERSEVLIDACPDCRGVWLDRGELDKILVRERQLGSGDPEEDFFTEVEGRRRKGAVDERQFGRGDDDERHGDDPRYGKRRKRGLLEQLLDFD